MNRQGNNKLEECSIFQIIGLLYLQILREYDAKMALTDNAKLLVYSFLNRFSVL